MDRFQVKLLEFVKKRDYFLKALVPMRRLIPLCMQNASADSTSLVISRLMKGAPKPRIADGGTEMERDKAIVWTAKG